MRFQCTFCFTIIAVADARLGTRLACTNCGKMVAVPRGRFEPGVVIGDFVISGTIGAGGMSTVYLARQLSMDRPVALKVLSAAYVNQEKYLRNFMREAKAAARLNHPNIIQAMAVGVDDGVMYYAMEYVRGMTLGHKIAKERRLPVDAALNIIQQAAEALHTAWTQEQLVHRDIKPDNLMLTDDGLTKVMDLGIAVTKEEAAQAEISGTPAFMAPEQFRRDKLDCRTDIYALGATLFNAVTGYPPFEGTDTQAVAQMHFHRPVSFPDPAVLSVPTTVQPLIVRMMAKDPAARYQTYDELLRAIVAIRRSLAVDQGAIPGVHTVTLSKYRWREDAAESPAEVFHRRRDDRARVAQARRPVVAPPRRGLWLVRLLVVLLLLLLIGILSLVIYLSGPRQPSLFVARAEHFVHETTDNERLALDRQYLGEVVERGWDILGAVPKQPNPKEEVAYFRLQAAVVDLQGRLVQMTIKDLLLGQESRFGQQLDQLRQALERLQELEQAARQQQQAVQGDRDAATALLATLRQQAERLEGRLRDLEAVEPQARHQREELARAQRFALFLRLSDSFRGGHADDLEPLLHPSASDSEALATWRAAFALDAAAAGRVWRRVAGTGDALAGESLLQGLVLSVGPTSLKLKRFDENGAEFHETVPLATLPASAIVTLARRRWPAAEPPGDAFCQFALWWGAFDLARELAPDEASRAHVEALLTGCFDWQFEEVRALAQAGYRELALAKARLFKKRYGFYERYPKAEEALLELFRSTAEPGALAPPAAPAPPPAPTPPVEHAP